MVSGKRIYINILAVFGVALMLLAMSFPWWSFTLEYNDPTFLYPYRLDGPGTEIIGYKRSPQMTLLTGVLIACILLALIGAFSPKRRSRWLLLASGVLNSLAVWRLLDEPDWHPDGRYLWRRFLGVASDRKPVGRSPHL